jgi:hypothetical protein
MMRKIHLAKSGFLDPIISTAPGVGFMRLYAIVEKWGGTYEQIALDCASGRLPHMRLHNNYFVLVDFRDDPNGMGGKFYTDNHYPKGLFPEWTNSRFTMPEIKKSNPARDFLLSMQLEQEGLLQEDKEIPLWMKPRFDL